MNVGPPRHIKSRMGSTEGTGEIQLGGKGILQRKMTRPAGLEVKRRLEGYCEFERNTTHE